MSLLSLKQTKDRALLGEEFCYMKGSLNVLTVAGVALGTAVLAVSARAVSITVPNYSFETPVSGGYYAPNLSITGWNFSDPDGFDVAGVQDQGPNGVGGPHTGNPIGTDQNQWAFVNLSNQNSTPTTGSITSAATLTTIASSTTYTLTVAVGSNTQLGGYQDAGNFEIDILANGVPVGTPGTLLAINNVKGTLQDISATFTSPASGLLIGQNLTVRLESSSSNVSDPFGGQQSLFDNVRLTAVPEPASIGLLGIAGLGILARRRRA